jgi:hypothetical protein
MIQEELVSNALELVRAMINGDMVMAEAFDPEGDECVLLCCVNEGDDPVPIAEMLLTDEGYRFHRKDTGIPAVRIVPSISGPQLATMPRMN